MGLESISTMSRTMFLALTVGMLLASCCRGDGAIEADSDNADCYVLQGTTTYK